MSDDSQNNGLSGWAGIALGRMWAHHEQSMKETNTWFANGRRSPVDVNAVMAQNHALREENARLRDRLNLYASNYDALDAWARKAEMELARLRRESC